MSSEWKGLFFFVLVSPSGYSEITYILNELPGLIFFSAFCLLAALWCVGMLCVLLAVDTLFCTG